MCVCRALLRGVMPQQGRSIILLLLYCCTWSRFLLHDGFFLVSLLLFLNINKTSSLYVWISIFILLFCAAVLDFGRKYSSLTQSSECVFVAIPTCKAGCVTMKKGEQGGCKALSHSERSMETSSPVYYLLVCFFFFFWLFLFLLQFVVAAILVAVEQQYEVCRTYIEVEVSFSTTAPLAGHQVRQECRRGRHGARLTAKLAANKKMLHGHSLVVYYCATSEYPRINVRSINGTLSSTTSTARRARWMRR